MILLDHVVSLELSKNIKELGVEQESLFYWVKSKDSIVGQKIFGIMFKRDYESLIKTEDMEGVEVYPALTASEMFDMFPKYIHMTDIPEPFNCFGWYIEPITLCQTFPVPERNYIMMGEVQVIYPRPEVQFFKGEYDRSLANCLAKNFVKLKKRGWI